MPDFILTVIRLGSPDSERFSRVLEGIAAGCPVRFLDALSPKEPLRGARILFALALDEYGFHPGLSSLLDTLRRTPHLLDGSVAGILVDGRGNLYTKSAAREVVLAANLAGCALIGRPLTEATGDLRNFTVQSRNAGCSLEEAYRLAAGDLIRRILTDSAPRHSRPRLLVLHASSHHTSNTMALWDRMRSGLEQRMDIREVGLRNGTLEDCAGCPYTMCLHFGERGECFYGGVIVKEVYPAVREADALMLLCPNYNDALSANMTACINRLTALYRTTPFTGKYLFAIAVSGYSGGELIASQLISALCMNKGFRLPPRFCLLETANDAGTAVRLPGIDRRLEEFSSRISAELCE